LLIYNIYGMLTLKWQYALMADASYFIILPCLTPDYFTCQEESASTQWVKLKIVIKFQKYMRLQVGRA
jgi:hypothetical protein